MSSTWEAVPRFYNPLKAGSIDGTDNIPHDHGVVRAMQAEYKPNKLVVGHPKATVFVGRLNPKTDESTLKRMFSRCGDIKRFRLIRDIVTGFSKGYGFIEYYDKYDAIKAVRDFDHTIVDDKEILVDLECERVLTGWIPRRLGGGLSGKKESGQLRFGGKERPFKKPILPFNLQDKRKYSDRHSSRDSSDRHSSYRKNKHYY
ncbi:U11/U12 small nuclear ribonucleoprotein 35 kDa protein [Parasteatoda tepidariorum]|uniref:U11/U12 small nuclear ribonucleoprotein 35 kDa protein n=1 Tax=Parasteatoda tepidariorum TaxID=114398 RepID=UPI00077FA922|nr:U11/U12 small nuclear ribonucleoprotein 35 kDa protein [Parasteatoda tepidariorum]